MALIIDEQNKEALKEALGIKALEAQVAALGGDTYTKSQVYTKAEADAKFALKEA